MTGPDIGQLSDWDHKSDSLRLVLPNGRWGAKDAVGNPGVRQAAGTSHVDAHLRSEDGLPRLVRGIASAHMSETRKSGEGSGEAKDVAPVVQTVKRIAY